MRCLTAIEPFLAHKQILSGWPFLCLLFHIISSSFTNLLYFFFCSILLFAGREEKLIPNLKRLPLWFMASVWAARTILCTKPETWEGKKTPNTTPTARSIVSRPIGHNQTAWLVMPDRKKMWVYGMRRYGFQCLWIVARNWEESSSSSSKKKISYKVSFRLNEFGEKAWDIKKTPLHMELKAYVGKKTQPYGSWQRDVLWLHNFGLVTHIRMKATFLHIV